LLNVSRCKQCAGTKSRRGPHSEKREGGDSSKVPILCRNGKNKVSSKKKRGVSNGGSESRVQKVERQETGERSAREKGELTTSAERGDPHGDEGGGQSDPKRGEKGPTTRV